MPAPPARIREEDFVPLAQLYGREARVFTDDGATSRRPRSRGTRTTWRSSSAGTARGAWYVGRARRTSASRPRARPARPWSGASDGALAVHVAAAVTHTIGGLQVDAQARRRRAPDGLWAAGVDAGGVATGGYASGLAQALVLGLAAAESIAAR